MTFWGSKHTLTRHSYFQGSTPPTTRSMLLAAASRTIFVHSSLLPATPIASCAENPVHDETLSIQFWSFTFSGSCFRSFTGILAQTCRVCDAVSEVLRFPLCSRSICQGFFSMTEGRKLRPKTDSRGWGWCSWEEAPSPLPTSYGIWGVL